jgi:hypothetical protein
VLPQVPSHQLLAFNALRWLGVQSELDLPPLPAAKALADVELTRYPLRDHTKTATTARPAASGLWDEPADAVESIVLTTKDGVVTLTRDGRDLKGRDDRIHAGSASVREYPVDEQSAHELLAAIAKPASPRALGKVDDARRRELGLDGSETLVVKAKATHELVLGGQVYGSSGRYALDRATGEAYVLEVRPLVTMSTGEAALRLRNLVPFDLADIARVVVVVHGAKLDLPVGDAVSAPPGTREALGALVARDLRALRPIEFVTDAQAGSLTQVAGVTVTAKAGATAELEILRDGSSALYVRSRRGLVRVPTTAEHLVHTIEQAIATPP